MLADLLFAGCIGFIILGVLALIMIFSWILVVYGPEVAFVVCLASIGLSVVLCTVLDAI
jgi:hypothetical protein